MQIISLQFFMGPSTVLVFHKPDCESSTKELCFGDPPEADFSKNVDIKS